MWHNRRCNIGIYEFLGEPYGKKAHQLLHTTYTPREKI
ncbi:hypothetical protein FL857_07230 [Criibacterium bergeronii]|uniref:Iron hydrogenase small subunit domain-containing protein n=1 Tax=Criibacterium bergeronii TaxID=1871336 RepID=A0A371IIR1_9FIRM|nr:hypothetical protein BBG48_010480 [Criibacterium bergeronii]TRW25474.1 hypothetical protein FL857_07230 [Criibacterium bergeronii]